MKKLLLLIIIAVISIPTFAQEGKWSDDKVRNSFKVAPFIFEGKIIEFRCDSHYTALKIKISKIFKGGEIIKDSTIEIIEQNARAARDPWGGVITLPPAYGYPTADEGIYFCELSTYPPLKNPSIFFTQKEKWKADNKSYHLPNNSLQFKVITQINLNDNRGLGRKFQNKKEIYSFFKQFPNLTIPPENK